MPYGAPTATPSARLDLTQYALKNFKRFAGVGLAGDGNPNNFLAGYRNSLLTDLADRAGPPFNLNVYRSLDDGATWNIFHTVGVNSTPNALTFQWNAAGNNLNIILAHGTTSGQSGIDLYDAATGVWNALRLASGIVAVNNINTADPKNFGMNADGTTFNATLIAVGTGGNIWRSTDGGSTWSARVSGTATSLVNVVSNGAGVWCAYGAGVVCRSTDDGLTWVASNPTILPDATRGSVTFGLGRFIGERNNGGTSEFISSIDGLTWEINFSRANFATHCVAFDQNGIVAFGGDAGTIYLTRDLLNFTLFTIANNPTSGEITLATLIASNIRIRTLFFDGSYQSNLLSNNRWLFSATNQADTTDNPLWGAQNLINDAA